VPVYGNSVRPLYISVFLRKRPFTTVHIRPGQLQLVHNNNQAHIHLLLVLVHNNNRAHINFQWIHNNYAYIHLQLVHNKQAYINLQLNKKNSYTIKKDFLHVKNFSNFFEDCHNINAKIIFAKLRFLLSNVKMNVILIINLQWIVFLNEDSSYLHRRRKNKFCYRHLLTSREIYYSIIFYFHAINEIINNNNNISREKIFIVQI